MGKPKRKAEEQGEAVKITSADGVISLLRLRYPSNSYAFFENVADRTGSANRYADALVMSLWQSRGLTLEGIEVKVTKQDVSRELSDPSKAEAVGKYCDAWWLAVGSREIVDLDKVPHGWGVLAPSKIRGETQMRVVKPAPKLDPVAMNRAFLASLLRRASENYDPDRMRQQVRAQIYDEIVAQVNRDVDRRHEENLSALGKRVETLTKDLSVARTALANLSGFHYEPAIIERACALLRWFGAWNGGTKQVEMVERNLDNQIHNLGAMVQAMREIKELVRLIEVRSPLGDERA